MYNVLNSTPAVQYMVAKRFGSIENRESCIKRAGFKCEKCFMARNEHRDKFGCDLNVDHIDGNGRFSASPNNDPDNLMCLCQKCHGKKDGLRADYSKRRSYKGESHPSAKIKNNEYGQIIDLRKYGLKLKEIGSLYGIQDARVSAICKILRG